MSTAETSVTKDTPLHTTNDATNDTSSETPITATATHESLEQLHLPDVPPPPALITLTPLRTLREGQGRSVEDIASALRLSQAQINALEDNRWLALPGAAYVKGFLRNYARYLGVDAQPYIDDYTAQTQPQIAMPASHAAPIAAPIKKTVVTGTEVLKNDPPALQSFSPSGEEKAPSKGLAMMVGLLIAATLAFLLYWERGLWLPKVEPYFKSMSTWFESTSTATPKSSTPVPSTAPAAPPTPATALDTPAATPSPDVKPAENPTSAVPAKPTTVDSAVLAVAATAVAAEANNPQTSVVNATPTPAPAIKPSDIKKPATGPIRALTLQFSKAAWIEVRDSGNNVLYYGTKPAGAQTIKGNAPLSVVIGAADAVSLKVDGQAFDVQGKAQGNVARFSIQ
jgi:cytoskeleton protein RodZ